MPKVIAEIKTFTSGIVATPDSKDIPTDAADYSLNVEPVASDGMVKGRKIDQFHTSDNTWADSNTTKAGAVIFGLQRVREGLD
tara:strand:+ start:1621 stop:1869 length:249 start_codon:yes stop_codon:yes gene_type:complete